MTDFRQDRSDEFKGPYPERSNPHGGRGRRAERNIAEEYTTQTGHPMTEQSSVAPGAQMPVDMPANTDPQREQHTRKGQAQSPRELTLNQPEKKRKGNKNGQP
jgi:hypothetical protein